MSNVGFYKASLLRTNIRAVIGKAGDFYFRLLVNQRLYINAVVALIAFLTASAVIGPPNAKGALFLFLIFWIAAIAYDLIELYKKIYDSVLGKSFLVVLFSLCTNFSIVLSSQIVNEIVGVDPSKFPHTVALLSILSIPFFVAAGFGVLYFIVLLLTPFLLLFHALPDDKAKEVLVPGYSAKSNVPYRKTTSAVQFLSFAVFCGFVFNLSQKVMHNYETFLTDTARSFLFQLEMYPKAQCAIKSGSRAAFIGDEKILLGEKKPSGIVFTVQECKSVP